MGSSGPQHSLRARQIDFHPLVSVLLLQRERAERMPQSSRHEQRQVGCKWHTYIVYTVCKETPLHDTEQLINFIGLADD